MSDLAEAAKKEEGSAAIPKLAAKVPVWVWTVGGILVLVAIQTGSGGGDESELLEPRTIETTETVVDTNADEEAGQKEPEPSEFEWPTLEPILLEGSGDDVVLLDSPVSAAAMDISANASSRYFGIKPILSSGDSGGSLVNTTDPFEGTVLLLGVGQDATAGFEVSSNGPWTFTIKSIAEVPPLGHEETIEGNGDALIRLDETQGLTTISVTGNDEGRYFGVRPHGNTYSSSVISTTDPYVGKVRLEPGTLLLEVTAIGAWSITLG